MQSRKSFAILPLLLLVNACSPYEFSAQGNSSVEPVTLVNGTFTTSCYSLGAGSFDITTVVTSTEFEITNQQYHDSSCSVPRRQYFYTYTYTDVGASSLFVQARNVNLVNGRMYITAFSSAAVSELNRSNECGFSDWQIHTPKDVSADRTCQVYPEGSPAYSIARSTNETFELGIPRIGFPVDCSIEEVRCDYFSSLMYKQ